MSAEASGIDGDLDQAALGRFLDGELGSGRLAITRIKGGQSNPTYIVDHGGRRMVLRKKPAGDILPGAHAIEREFRVQSALARTDVPVASPVLLCEDEGIIGTPFYLMDWVEGRVFHDAALPGVDAQQRHAMYLAAAETMARMHALDPEAIGLGDYGRPGNYFERQIKRWAGQYEAAGRSIPAIDTIVPWLRETLPPDDGRSSIAHGDFRFGNLMFHPSEPRVVAVLDWELSTLGHPLADLGFCCMPWHTSPDEFGGVLGLDHAQMGIPAQALFVERYFATAAPTAPLQPFHVAFGLFRFAVIFVGIAERAAAGIAAGDDTSRAGHLAERFAQRSLEAAGLAAPGTER